mgnify:CR=1 FL=1
MICVVSCGHLFTESLIVVMCKVLSRFVVVSLRVSECYYNTYVVNRITNTMYYRYIGNFVVTGIPMCHIILT